MIVASAVCADEVVPPTLVVRSGPGAQYRQVGVLKQGTPVQPIGQASRGYLPVSFAGGRGWAPERFIRRSGQPASSSQPGALGTNPFTPVPAPTQPGTPGMTTPATPGMATPATPAQPTPALPIAPLPPQPQPQPAQPAIPGVPATPATPNFTPTPLGGPSNTGSGTSSGSNPLGNILGTVGNVLGGSSSSQNSNPLTSALGNLANGGGSGSNPLQSLLGGSGSGGNPLQSLLGGSNSGRGPSILNSGNTSPITGGGTPAATTPGGTTPAPGGNFSNPGAVGKTVSVTATQLNVRTGPGTQYRVIGALFQGAQVQVTNNSGPWFEILQTSGAKGWVHGAYLNGGGGQKLAPTSTIPGGPSVNTGATGALPGSAGSGAPPGAGNERRSRRGFIQLANSGTGYYTYYAASKRWARPTVVYGVMRTARRLAQAGLPQLGVGDMSLENGGDIQGHAAHENGNEVDCRLMYSDRVNRPGTINHPSYSSAWTTTAIRIMRSEIPTRTVLFNDRSTIRAGYSRYFANHANHFHFGSR